MVHYPSVGTLLKLTYLIRVTFYGLGTAAAPGSLHFNVTPGQPALHCALNSVSLPLDQAALTNADQLANDISSVLQVRNCDAPIQDLLAWSNGFNFGDIFPTTADYPHIARVDNTGPTPWP